MTEVTSKSYQQYVVNQLSCVCGELNGNYFDMQTLLKELEKPEIDHDRIANVIVGTSESLAMRINQIEHLLGLIFMPIAEEIEPDEEDFYASYAGT
tara:strand:+ start:2112 stop:2399 length:288 start_codon:yes stop_codon:yes gene_type:complete